jgi:hypothetical protein
MNHVRGHVDIWAMQREYFAWAHRGLAYGKDRPLDDQPVVVGAALACAATQALILLVAC